MPGESTTAAAGRGWNPNANLIHSILKKSGVSQPFPREAPWSAATGGATGTPSPLDRRFCFRPERRSSPHSKAAAPRSRIDTVLFSVKLALRGGSRRAVRGLPFLLLAAVLAGASARAGTELDVPLFAGGYGLSFFEETARLYEQQRPGVRVRLHGDPRISDKLRIQIIGGAFPDVASADLPWQLLAASGRLLDLSPYLDEPCWEGGKPWRDTFLPGSLDRWTQGSATFAVPLPYAPFAVFYNKQMFREHGWTPPATWDEFLALCEKMKEAGVVPLAFPGVYPFYADSILKAAYYNLAGPEGYARYLALDPGTRENPRFVRAAGLLQTLARKDFQPGWEGATHTSAQLQFFRGETAMMVNGAWLVSEMQGKIPADFELGAFNFPVFPDGAGDPSALQNGSDYYFVFRATKHPREAVDFLKFLTSRERATAFTRTLDTPTAVQGIPSSAYSPRMQDIARLIRQAAAGYGEPPGQASRHGDYDRAYVDARFQLLNGTISPTEFARSLESAARTARGREADPAKVDARHPAATAVLLTLLAAAAVTMLRTAWRARRRGAPWGNGTQPVMRWHTAWIFLLPAILLYTFIVVKPGLEAIVWATLRWDGVNPAEFVGLRNFQRLLLESDAFWRALRNNLFLMCVPTVIVLPLALLFATLISRGVWGAKLYRVCFFFPNILGAVTVTILWLNAYEPHGGLVNAALVKFGDLCAWLSLAGPAAYFHGFRDFAWLSQQNLYWALVPMTVWAACGFNMVLYLAAMEGIDETYYEAAEIDGASAWQQFRRITFPMIREVLVITLVFSLIGGLKAFETIWLLTSQQPTTQTHVIGTLMISTLFNDFRLGEATAIGVTLFVLVFFGSAALLGLRRREALDT